MKISIHHVVLTKAAWMLLFAGFASADVAFYTDEADWRSAVHSASVETLLTDADGVGMADEVGDPPITDAILGQILIFDAARTGLSRSVEVVAFEFGAEFVFDDDHLLGDALSVGDLDVFEDDNWELNVLSGPALTAFGFDLVGNQDNAGERWSIFGQGNRLVGVLEDIPMTSGQGDKVFLGFVSSEPIVRMSFDEDVGRDDIAIANLRFAQAPEPTGAGVFACMAAWAAFRHRRGHLI